MKTTRHNLIAVLFTWLQTALCPAQPAYVLDPEFKPAIRPTADPAAVTEAAVQPDGKVLVNGSVRLNPDGTLDPSFRPAIDIPLSQPLVFQPDGKILVRANDGIVRLNSDGSRDLTWTPYQAEHLSGLNSSPDDGVLLTLDDASSEFFPRSFLKLGADGLPDPSFQPEVVGWLLWVQSDGRLLVANAVQRTNLSVEVGWLVRLNPDGSLDRTFQPPAATYFQSAIVQADGKLVITGAFSSLGGQPRRGLARLLSSGALDEGFNPDVTALSTVAGWDSWSGNLALDPRGRIVLLVVGPDNEAHLIFIERSGTVEREVTVTGLGLDQTQRHPILGFLPDDSLIVQDRQPTPCCKGSTIPHFARLAVDGFVDPTFFAAVGALPNFGEGDAIALQEDGRILVKGDLWVDGHTAGPFVRFSSNGAFDKTYSTPAGFYFEPYSSFALLDGGKLLVHRWNSASASRTLVRLGLNGAVDPTFAETPGPDIGAGILRLVPQGIRGIVAEVHIPTNPNAGGFVRVLRRIRPSGLWDDAFQVPLGQTYVTALAVDQSDRILVSTNNVYSEPRGLMRLNPDGMLDQSFNSGLVLRAGESIEGLFPVKDGRIMVQCRHQDNGRESAWLARLLSAGSIDTTFPQTPRPGLLQVLAIADDGATFVWSDTQDGSYQLIRFAADGTEDTLLSRLIGIENQRIIGPVRAALVEPDGSLVIAGGFTAIGNAERPGLARLKPAPVWRSLAFDAAGRFTGTIGCLTGWKYRVEASADLKQWNIVATGASAGESVPFSDTAPPGTARHFYRVVKE